MSKLDDVVSPRGRCENYGASGLESLYGHSVSGTARCFVPSLIIASTEVRLHARSHVPALTVQKLG